jgi:hypothetical protein
MFLAPKNSKHEARQVIIIRANQFKYNPAAKPAHIASKAKAIISIMTISTNKRTANTLTIF